jgi:hypothetical protein
VGEIDKTQQKMSNQIDISAQILERVVKDQAVLARQLDATGQAVARLIVDRPSVEEVPRPSRPSVRRPPMGELGSDEDTYGPPHHPGAQGGRAGKNLFHQHLPKMSFPRFNGENPRIWKDKCLDYFHIFSLPEALWLPTATMFMYDNATRWLQVYKLKQGLTIWTTFIAAMEEQFGSYEYRDAMGEIVALTQEGSLEDYISAFTDLQYQVQMHNQGLDEIYFVTQFVKGLKVELAVGVQSQVPKSMKKAIMLAKVQQQLMDSKQFKFSRQGSTGSGPPSRFEQKSAQPSSGLWKERQLRDFRKASGLCIYCGDKYNVAHAASCTKRPQAQIHAMVVNPLDTELSEDILNQLAIEDVVTKDLQ